MTFQLKSLGPYRIERSEEYAPGGSDSSYAEMVRVRGSKPKPPYFMVPSHLYKHSESELGLYLFERKNLWRALGKALNLKIDISGKEIMVNFPISLFPDIAKIVPFVRKAIRKIPYTEEEKRKMVLNLHKGRSSMTGGIDLKTVNSRGKASEDNLIPDGTSNPDNPDKKSHPINPQREVRNVRPV